jgi:hypothetical protein
MTDVSPSRDDARVPMRYPGVVMRCAAFTAGELLSPNHLRSTRAPMTRAEEVDAPATDQVVSGVKYPCAASAVVTVCRGVVQVYDAPAARPEYRQLPVPEGTSGLKFPAVGVTVTADDERFTTEKRYATVSPAT